MSKVMTWKRLVTWKIWKTLEASVTVKDALLKLPLSLTGLLYFILNFLDPLVCARSHKHYS
jgi:hypothetical protein